MSDGVYKNHNVNYEDMPIMVCEDVINMFGMNVDLFQYLYTIHRAAIIRE